MDAPRFLPRSITAGLLALAWFTIGCDPPPRPQLKPADPPRPATPVETPEEEIPSGLPRNGAPLRFAVEAPFDLWDAYFLNGEQVGYSHIHAEPAADGAEIRYRVSERMMLRRNDTVLDQHLQQTSFETPDGRLLRFEAELGVNGTRTTTRGEVVRNQLVITTERGGETQQRQIPWDRSIGGLLAMQQSLKETPLKSGEQRRIRALAPMFYEVGELDMQGVGIAAVPLLDGETHQLQEAESISSIEGNPLLKMHLWIDDDGNVLKSYAPNLGLSIFRTDEETAKQFAAPQQDLLAETQIPLDRAIERPRELQASAFLVEVRDPDLAARLLQDAPGQRVRQEQGTIWQVAVVQGLDRDFDAPPGDGDRRPGPLVQSNDKRVQALASFPKTQDKAQLAEQLARVVYTTVTEKNLESGFASAAEVAQSHAGDCTEHAVLLAAMCRARGIPARVAAGLLYIDSAEGPALGFHMWTLAYVDDGWLALDGTMEDGLAAADRITLVTNDLASGTEYAMVAPVMQSVGQLKITVKSLRHEPAAAEPPASQAETPL